LKRKTLHATVLRRALKSTLVRARVRQFNARIGGGGRPSRRGSCRVTPPLSHYPEHSRKIEDPVHMRAQQRPSADGKCNRHIGEIVESRKKAGKIDALPVVNRSASWTPCIERSLAVYEGQVIRDVSVPIRVEIRYTVDKPGPSNFTVVAVCPYGLISPLSYCRSLDSFGWWSLWIRR